MLRLEKTPLPYFSNEEPMTQRRNISFLRWGFPKMWLKKIITGLITRKWLRILFGSHCIAFEILVPWQEFKTVPVQQKYGVWTTRPPGKSPDKHFYVFLPIWFRKILLAKTNNIYDFLLNKYKLLKSHLDCGGFASAFCMPKYMNCTFLIWQIYCMSIIPLNLL